MNKQSKKVSCIDIGSNAIKYRQYRLLPNNHLELDTFKRVSLRLGSEAFSSGKMTDETYLDFLTVLKKLKIPSPILVGAMALSGLFYTFEIVNARFPDFIINIAFIFLGTALGSRLNGLKLKELFFYIFHGVIVSSILVIVAMVTSYFLQFLGFDFIPTFLSFAPGGIHEMVVISVAYNIDPIFVSYHHFLRILIIVALSLIHI